MSLEKPNADIAIFGDNQPYSRIPDVTLGLRYETPDWHVQWANLFRDLAVQSANDDRTRTTEAYATQVTFAAGVFGEDSVQGWASFGKGYANFLQDITGFGLDAAFNTSLELEAIDALRLSAWATRTRGAMAQYERSYGYLKIDPDANVLHRSLDAGKHAVRVAQPGLAIQRARDARRRMVVGPTTTCPTTKVKRNACK
jgi:hypothetical protein